MLSVDVFCANAIISDPQFSSHRLLCCVKSFAKIDPSIEKIGPSDCKKKKKKAVKNCKSVPLKFKFTDLTMALIK